MYKNNAATDRQRVKPNSLVLANCSMSKLRPRLQRVLLNIIIVIVCPLQLSQSSARTHTHTRTHTHIYIMTPLTPTASLTHTHTHTGSTKIHVIDYIIYELKLNLYSVELINRIIIFFKTIKSNEVFVLVLSLLFYHWMRGNRWIDAFISKV